MMTTELTTEHVLNEWQDVTADRMAAIGRPMVDQSRGLTVDDIAELRRPFTFAEHSTNYGGWPFIEKGPLMKRVKEVDPAASLLMGAPHWTIHEGIHYKYYEGQGNNRREVEAVDQFAQVSIAATIVIKGVAHMDYGSCDISRRGKQWNEPTKEAATDAIKRACMQAGLGAYLLWFSGDWQRDGAAWLDRLMEAWAAQNG